MDKEPCDEQSDESIKSDYFYEHICQPCKADGRFLEAEGRCEDCDEFLCNRCFLYHTIPSITRNHVVTPIENLQKDSASAERTDRCTQVCAKHTDEIIKYYCPTHLFLGCSACIIMEHKNCEDTVYIPSVAKDILNETDFIAITISENYLKESAQQIIADVTREIDLAESKESDTVIKIRRFREEITNALEKVEKEYIYKAEKEKSENVSKLKDVQQQGAVVEKELSEIFSRIQVFKERKQLCNMYVELRKHQPVLKEIENTLSGLNSAHKDAKSRLSKFKSNQDDVTNVVESFRLAIDKTGSELSELKYCKDIDVHTTNDSKRCWISSSILLTEQKLLVSDLNNNKLKLVDTSISKVVEEFSLPAGSRNITRTGKCEVAATIPVQQKIMFVCFDPAFQENRSIDVNGECHGLAYFNNKLVVSFKDPDKVVIMDMQGSTLQTVASNENVDSLVNEPLYVAVNTANERLYVSNADGGFVLCLDYKGNVIAKYNDYRLTLTTGLTIDSNGLVYICDWRTHTVHQITQNCKKKNILANKQMGLHQPYTTSFDEDNDRFYVGMRDKNVIKVFRAFY